MWMITEREASRPAVLGALWAIAEVGGEPSPDQRGWIEEVARRHGTTAQAHPDPAVAAEVRQALPEAEDRQRLLRHQVMVALLGGTPSEATIAAVQQWSRDLGVKHYAVKTLLAFAEQRYRALMMTIMPRSFIASLFKGIWKREGLRGLWRAIVAAARIRNRRKAARYQALGELPEGTLGRTLHDHCRANEFAMPGEKHGTPEILLFHDIGHALTGKGADGPGEVWVAAFEAGYMKGDDAYSITLFSVYAFGHGAPIIPDFATRAGDFSVAPFLEAYATGETLDRDLRFWDPWALMGAPVDEAKRALGMRAAAAPSEATAESASAALSG